MCWRTFPVWGWKGVDDDLRVGRGPWTVGGLQLLVARMRSLSFLANWILISICYGLIKKVFFVTCWYFLKPTMWSDNFIWFESTKILVFTSEFKIQGIILFSLGLHYRHFFPFQTNNWNISGTVLFRKYVPYRSMF